MVVYYSVSGKTGEMAEYIAEGIRFNDLQAVVKKMDEIKDAEEMLGFDGYILGSPTFSLDIPNPVKTFLAMLKGVNLEDKLSGAFGPYLHDASYEHNGHAPTLILDVLQKENKIKSFNLGGLTLNENIVETREGIQACHDYGRMFGQKLGS
jgi:flavorubredoxin